VHRVGSPLRWLADERKAGAGILGVELADEAVRLADLAPARLADLAPARRWTVMVLGHEAPQSLRKRPTRSTVRWRSIRTVGTGSSLNVAVAGSLMLYKIAGLL
jgi:tRNA (guanosine-2'-O-)-methyltransferase